MSITKWEAAKNFLSQTYSKDLIENILTLRRSEEMNDYQEYLGSNTGFGTRSHPISEIMEVYENKMAGCNYPITNAKFGMYQIYLRNLHNLSSSGPEILKFALNTFEIHQRLPSWIDGEHFEYSYGRHQTTFFEILSWLIETNYLHKNEFFCFLLLDHRIYKGNSASSLMHDLQLNTTITCDVLRPEYPSFNLMHLHGSDFHVMQPFVFHGFNPKAFDNSCYMTTEVIQIFNKMGQNFCSWTDYIKQFGGLTDEIMEQSQNNFLSSALFGMTSELLNISPIPSKALSFGSIFLQAFSLYAMGTSLLPLGVGIASTMAFNRLGFFSKKAASRAGTALSQLISGGSVYSITASLLGDYLGRGMVTTVRDKYKEQQFYSSLNNASLSPATIAILEEKLDEDTINFLKCCYTLSVVEIPVIAPNGRLFSLDPTQFEALPQKDLTWEDTTAPELTDLRPALQLKVILTALADFFENPTTESANAVVEKMYCVKTGKPLFGIEDRDKIFINPTGCFIRGTKMQLGMGVKNIKDSEGNFYPPNLQREFFNKLLSIMQEVLAKTSESSLTKL